MTIDRRCGLVPAAFGTFLVLSSFDSSAMSGVSNMKSREAALRLKRFEAEAKRRKVMDLEQMIRDFQHMAFDLDRQVQAEEDRTGIKDKSHFTYSTLAKAAAQRRDKLLASVADLQVKLEAAVRERDEALVALEKAALPDQRDQSRGPRTPDRVSDALMRWAPSR
jgi:flagellar protein FliJ